MQEKLTIRELAKDDCIPISAAFTAQGWNRPAEQYLRYWQESQNGSRMVLVAEYGGEFAGYLTICWVSHYPPFREATIPEIVDFTVLIKHRRQGIGTALMDACEQQIKLRSPVAGIGVGLDPDYGAAQVLYIKRGYIPDGRGIFQDGHHLTYGERVIVNDDLVLFLTKKLMQ